MDSAGARQATLDAIFDMEKVASFKVVGTAKLHTAPDYEDGHYIASVTHLFDVAVSSLSHFMEFVELLGEVAVSVEPYGGHLKFEADDLTSAVIAQVRARFGSE
jgi:hypothetical protein